MALPYSANQHLITGTNQHLITGTNQHLVVIISLFCVCLYTFIHLFFFLKVQYMWQSIIIDLLQIYIDQMCTRVHNMWRIRIRIKNVGTNKVM